MADNKEIIDMLRGKILAYEETVKEGKTAERHLETAQAYLESLLTDEVEVNGMSTSEAIFKAFESTPDASLFIAEIVRRMRFMGWKTNASRPDAIVRGTLHRNLRIERVGRGQYRLRTEAEKETDAKGFKDVTE